MHPVEEKVDAVKRAPVPQNVSELRSFLGMVYRPFLPNFATALTAHELLKNRVQWTWTKECQPTYEACKQGLTTDVLLVHYDGNRELELVCDASSYEWNWSSY